MADNRVNFGIIILLQVRKIKYLLLEFMVYVILN
jgi:hypothetical protein